MICLRVCMCMCVRVRACVCVCVAQGGLMIGAPMLDGHFRTRGNAVHSGLYHTCAHSGLTFVLRSYPVQTSGAVIHTNTCFVYRISFLINLHFFLSIRRSICCSPLISTCNYSSNVEQGLKLWIRFGYPCAYNRALSLRIGCMFARNVD